MARAQSVAEIGARLVIRLAALAGLIVNDISVDLAPVYGTALPVFNDNRAKKDRRARCTDFS